MNKLDKEESVAIFDDLLLIGEAGSGKTCFATLISGEDLPTTYNQTKQFQKYQAKDGFFFGRGMRTDVMEIGGDNNDALTFKRELGKAQAVLYFFDGTKFLKELRDSSQGGVIGCHLRHNLLSFLVDSYDSVDDKVKANKYGNDVKRYVQEYLAQKVFFVATHADCAYNMQGEIARELSNAQKEYSKYGHRYFFQDLFMSRLHCINATDKTTVKNLFEDVKRITKNKK